MALPLRPLAARAYHAIRDPRFAALQRRTHGMLSPAVYRRLYDEMRATPDLDVVEIGGAAGAGSIAIAWALRDAGKTSHLVVVEKCEGGSRSRIGDRQDNLHLILGNFRRFGVADRVTLYPHQLTLANGDEVLRLVSTPQIAALVHDADGAIDRDIALFWPRLRPGGLIVIDDVDIRPDFKPVSPRHPRGGTKAVLTTRLLDQLIRWGLIEPVDRVRNTLFARKPLTADLSRLDLTRCAQIHDEVRDDHARWLREHRVLPA